MDDGTWMRIAENLAARVSGPMKFRLVVQPITAAIFAIRSGLADATAGKPPYLWTVVSDPVRRADLIKDGWKSIGRVFLIALAMDVVYQIVVSRSVYPGEAIIVAVALAIVPYVILRGLVTRLARARPLHIGLIILGVGVMVVVTTLFLIRVNRARSTIEQKASAELGRTVDVGPLRFSLWSGSLSAETLTIGDDPAFSVAPFLAANSVTIEVERWPLIAFGSLNVTRIRVEHPTVNLIRHSSGRWNYSSLGLSSLASSALPIAKLEFNDGRMVVATTTRTRTYEHVNLAASNVPMPSVWRVIANAVLPGGATFSVMGDIGPMNPVDPSLTPIDATIGARLPATALESFLPELGIDLPRGSHLTAGTLVANLNVVGATNRLVATGTAGVLNARLTGFDVWSKLRALSAFNALDAGGDLDIEEMTTDLRMTEDKVRFDHLDGVITSLGHVTGVGTIDAANNLDVRMVAILTGPAGGSGVAVGTAGAVNESQRIPFLIRGPMSDPQFVLDKSSLSIGSSP